MPAKLSNYLCFIMYKKICIKFYHDPKVSKVGNITEIMKSVNVPNYDINLKTGFVPKYIKRFQIAACFKTVLTFKNGLNLKITV